jgi:hypothetical protein
MARTKENFLLCLGTVIARSGAQVYLASELGSSDGSDEEITVDRPTTEVADPAFIASLEGCTLTRNHPRNFIDSTSNRTHDVGVVLRPRLERLANGGVIIRADLLIKDSDAIDSVVLGLNRQISVGYDYVLSERAGKLAMTCLRANHVSLVGKGRANANRAPGYPRAEIRDTAAAHSLTTGARTDKRIENLVASVAQITASVDKTPARRAHATDSVRFRDRGNESLESLAEELRRDSDDDDNSYGSAITGAFLGQPVIRGVENFREQRAARNSNAVRGRANDADAEAAELFQSACAARFAELQR